MSADLRLKLNYLVGFYSLVRVDFEHFINHIRSSFIMEELMPRVIRCTDSFKELLISLSFKWENTCKGHEQEDTQRPDICCLSLILFSLDYLR